MQVELLAYERRSLETLEREFGIETEIVGGFAQSLNALRKMCEKLLGGKPEEFRDGRIVVIGLANHAHHLLAGGLQALEVGNGLVWSNCVLALIETFGACLMISEQPEAITSLLEAESSEKFLNAAAHVQPELGPDISRLHRVVRPGPEAAYAGFRSVDDKGCFTDFEFGLRRTKPSEGREGMIVLANLAYYLQMKLEALAKDTKVLSAGQVVTIRSGQIP